MVAFKNLLADYANIVKSFIGCNYLSVAFAFRKGGLGLSIILLFFIVFLTEHCCNLIVVCKRHLLRLLFNAMPVQEDGTLSESTIEARALINKKMQLGDIGEHAFGRLGRAFVTLALFITQFGFCVNYFIFIGNTLKEVFPVHNINSTRGNLTHEVDVFDEELISTPLDKVSTAPSLYILVAAPLPIFIGFSLLRSVRKLGFVSIIANISILVGCVVIFSYLVSGFSVSPFNWFVWSTSPITMALMISSFEGIGTILPIEGSMVGNQHNFRRFLIGGISSVAFLLLLFGVLGYLRYGETTGQLLVQNIPDNSILSAIVDCTLIVGIIFTFPLQEMPVLAITEIVLFTKGGLCYRGQGDDKPLLPPGDSEINSYGTQEEPIENYEDSETLDESQADKFKILAPNWLRCLVRITMVLIQMGVAMLMKDKYAYVSALTGSLGSAFLAFIVPCAAHAKLMWNELPTVIKVKDICVVVFGFVVSIWSLVVTLKEVISAS